MPGYDTVSLLTDFGYADEFVGVMKAVIRDLAPHAATIDLSHGIPPFNVRAGSLALARAVAYLPAGVVVAVVDPGVGTGRRGIALEVANGDGVFVGPDNGLLAPAVAMAGGAERAVELTNPDYQLGAPGATFAGRDIFAPAAAHLCNGVALTELGDPIDPSLLLPGAIPLSRREGEELICEVLWVDHYGNCQLNVSPEDLPDGWGSRVQIRFGAPDRGGPEVRSARRVSTFADLGRGEVGLVLDSTGLLTIAFDQRSAATELDLAANDQIIMSALDDIESTATPVHLNQRATREGQRATRESQRATRETSAPEPADPDKPTGARATGD